MDAIKDLKYLLLILLGLWVIWFFTGGPARIENSKNPFVKPAKPIDTGQVYGPK